MNSEMWGFFELGFKSPYLHASLFYPERACFFIADAEVTYQSGYRNLTHAFFSLGTQCYWNSDQTFGKI